MINNLKEENMGLGIRIFVSKEYKFTTDTLILADFCDSSLKDSILEIGTGIGAIPLILIRDNKAKHVTALEIQSKACDILRKTLVKNRLEDKITIINKDIRDRNALPIDIKYDVVICNPPYKKENSGKASEELHRALARNETECTLRDIISVASSVLKPGGDLYMCNRPERMCDMISIMREYRIEPKIFRLVQYNVNKEPKLMLIKGKKFGKVGLRCKPTLIITNEIGEYTYEMKSVYKQYYRG